MLRSHICHRDLKLEIVLVQCPTGENKAPLVKIADFGLAKKMAQDELQHMRTQCGTPQYVAPEIIMVSHLLPLKAWLHHSEECLADETQMIHARLHVILFMGATSVCP